MTDSLECPTDGCDEIGRYCGRGIVDGDNWTGTPVTVRSCPDHGNYRVVSRSVPGGS